MERPNNVSVWDRRDLDIIFQSVLLRLTVNAEKLKRIELIPVTIDVEGELYGVPRLASDQRGREIIACLRPKALENDVKFQQGAPAVPLEAANASALCVVHEEIRPHGGPSFP